MGEACATLRRDAVHRAASSVSCFSCNTGSGELSVGVGRELRDWGVMRVAWPPTRVMGFSRGESTTFYVIFYSTHT